MTTSKIETLTEGERMYSQAPPGVWNKALRIIDAHAAERAALTEQVAQLTAALENIALGTVHPAEREVARLTAALAAAEYDHHESVEAHKLWEQQCGVQSERAEAAERDRDAANALLRRHMAPSSNGIGDDSLFAETRAHLSGQPAAPARPLCPRCGWVSTRESTGDDDTWARCKCWEPEGPSHLYGQPAAPARTDSGVAAMTALHQMAAAPAPTAAEARVRELEAENTTMRVNNRVLEADSADLLDRRRAAESELAALRERVAFAIAWLTDIEPKPHSKSWNALEALRG